MFNREYHRRAARLALQRVGAGLALDDSHFYRPVARVAPGPRTLPIKLVKAQKRSNPNPAQLDLFPAALSSRAERSAVEGPCVPDPDRPLADIFPEAYQ